MQGDNRLFNRIRHKPQRPVQPSAASFCHLPELLYTTCDAARPGTEEEGGKDVPDPHPSSSARGLEKRCKFPSRVRCHVVMACGEMLLFNKFFRLSMCALVAKT